METSQTGRQHESQLLYQTTSIFVSLFLANRHLFC